MSREQMPDLAFIQRMFSSIIDADQMELRLRLSGAGSVWQDGEQLCSWENEEEALDALVELRGKRNYHWQRAITRSWALYNGEAEHMIVGVVTWPDGQVRLHFSPIPMKRVIQKDGKTWFDTASVETRKHIRIGFDDCVQAEGWLTECGGVFIEEDTTSDGSPRRHYQVVVPSYTPSKV